MKLKKTTINYSSHPKKSRSSVAKRCAIGTMAMAAALPLVPAEVRADDVPSRVHFLANFEFSNQYLTPRGMIVHDQGLAAQQLFLGLINVYHSDCFINDVTLVPGVWNDFSTAGVSVHPPFGSEPKTSWVEIDPIAGISIAFAKNFKLDVTYTAFAMQVLDIGTSQHLDTKLSFDDTKYLKAFALHPYFEFWQELDGKATDADVPEAVFGPSPKSGSHPAPGPSYYFEVGVTPGYTFKNVCGGLKIEAPCRVLLPNERFYGEYYGDASFVGLFEVGLRGTVPMNFMPKGYGHWAFQGGVRYQYFVDNNLFHLNEFNAPGKPTRDTVQGYVGVSIFF